MQIPNILARTLAQIKRRHHALNKNDQRALWVLTWVVCGMLFYGGLWYPLAQWASHAQHKFINRIVDWQWVVQHQERAMQLEKQLARQRHEHQPLIALVPDVAKQQGLILAQIHPEGAGITVETDAVPFSALLQFLTDLHRRYAVRIDRLQVDKLPKGHVKAQVVLSPYNPSA